MNVYKIYPTSINEAHIAAVVEALRRGDIIVYPTDTHYALGCDALNQRAIERLCQIKGINPQKQLLSVVCADLSQASEWARIDNQAFRLMRRHLPGPFTFILPAETTLPKVFRPRKTVGVRIPDNAIAVAVAAALGHPLVTSSISGMDPEDLANPEAIAMHYDGVADALIDGGEANANALSSTIVDCLDSSSPEIVRQGAGQLS